MNEKERAVMQQALEALTVAWQQNPRCPRWQITESMHALRAALAQQAEPAQEPVAWECKAGGLKALTQRQYDAQTAAIKRHYTRIAPPQRPRLTDEEIDSIHIHLSNTVGSSYKTLARAIERKVRGEA